MGLGLSGKLNTAFVERLNLTVRQSVAALIRRTWSTMHQAPQLLLHLEWWRGYYHFVRPHASLGVALGQPIARGGMRQPQRYRQRTPAIAAGLTSRHGRRPRGAAAPASAHADGRRLRTAKRGQTAIDRGLAGGVVGHMGDLGRLHAPNLCKNGATYS